MHVSSPNELHTISRDLDSVCRDSVLFLVEQARQREDEKIHIQRKEVGENNLFFIATKVFFVYFLHENWNTHRKNHNSCSVLSVYALKVSGKFIFSGFYDPFSHTGKLIHFLFHLLLSVLLDSRKILQEPIEHISYVRKETGCRLFTALLCHLMNTFSTQRREL